MTSMTRWSAALTLAAALTLGACGGDDSTDDDTDAGPSPDPAVTLEPTFDDETGDVCSLLTPDEVAQASGVDIASSGTRIPPDAVASEFFGQAEDFGDANGCLWQSQDSLVTVEVIHDVPTAAYAQLAEIPGAEEVGGIGDAAVRYGVGDGSVLAVSAADTSYLVVISSGDFTPGLVPLARLAIDELG